MSDSSSSFSIRDRALGIIAAGAILAILYFARDVRVPITLAVILSLLISPFVRALRRLGAGATSSVLIAVVAFAVACGAVAGVSAASFSEALQVCLDGVEERSKS